jgi:hypothetical protein
MHLIIEVLSCTVCHVQQMYTKGRPGMSFMQRPGYLPLSAWLTCSSDLAYSLDHPYNDPYYHHHIDSLFLSTTQVDVPIQHFTTSQNTSISASAAISPEFPLIQLAAAPPMLLIGHPSCSTSTEAPSRLFQIPNPCTVSFSKAHSWALLLLPHRLRDNKHTSIGLSLVPVMDIGLDTF